MDLFSRRAIEGNKELEMHTGNYVPAAWRGVSFRRKVTKRVE